MKKQYFIILSFITMHAYSMQTGQSFPDEIVASVIQCSLPKLNLYYDKHPEGMREYQNNVTQAKNNLEKYIFATMNLRFINTRFNTIITKNIATWLNLNQHNVNALLIRSAQANIPYFIKLAMIHNANPDCIDTLNGYTPLLRATENNDYLACKFLLEKGASVNIKKQPPRVFGYGYNPGLWPIHIAIAKENLELVNLFIEYGCTLDFAQWMAESLLSRAVKKNNPSILSALLQAHIPTDDSHWGKRH
jgi:ankyrin repeat protein